MSCQIKGFSQLIDCDVIKDFLIAGAYNKFKHVPKDELPLQDILISLSPTGDVLALSWSKRLVILTSKWDSQEVGEVKNKFHVAWRGEITKEPNEIITSIACLPLISLSKASARNGPDWTCIAVGFSTGFLRFYTESGALLLSDQLHNESILGIKCQSHTTARHAADSAFPEEIHVLYNTVICILPGFPLFSTLRACRSHLARVKANCDDNPQEASNLSYKKWGFRNQDMINDSQVVGTTSVDTFDHLMTASICGGFHATYRSSAPQHNLVMATGKRPFIGFHYALEGASAPLLSEVAVVMASKLANAIVPWFRSGSKNSLQEKQKIAVQEPAESMTCRFGLSDVMREGGTIVACPNKTLSVICDAMGRVTLIDNKRGVAVRMWKGYRDAQCGWLQVTEERHRNKQRTGRSSETRSTSQLRTALFLVIYAPKKSVIDIWSVRQGAKITTFTASKNGRLIYTNYGLFGLNDMALSTPNRAQYPCVFIDPIGGIKEITVPFHFALSSKNGKKARDLHILKKLKTYLREEDYDEDKLTSHVRKVCDELRTDEVKLQVIELLSTNRNVQPDTLLAALDCFLVKLESVDVHEMDPITKTLRLTSMQIQDLIWFYKYARSQFDSPPEYETIAGDRVPSVQRLTWVLMTTEREINRIIKLAKIVDDYAKNLESKSHGKVTFKDDTNNFMGFLSCFEIGVTGLIGLHRDLSDDKKQEIAKLICHGWMYSNESIDVWKEAAVRSAIKPAVLICFALMYWTKRKSGAPLEIELKRFAYLLHAVCSIANVEEICVEYNELSSWWRRVRDILTDSSNPFHALTAAITCRAVGIKIEQSREHEKYAAFEEAEKARDEKIEKSSGKKSKEEEAKESTSATTPNEEYSYSSDWEAVSKDTCQFTLLIGNLEDVTVLNAILSQRAPNDDTSEFTKLPYSGMESSLGSILSRGKGSISEIVARWISTTGVDPACLVDSTDMELDEVQFSVNVESEDQPFEGGAAALPLVQSPIRPDDFPIEIGSEAKVDMSAQTWVLEKLTLLKRHFPYSLTSSVLLANLCWEYVMAWNKEIVKLEYLDAALKVLRQIPTRHMKQGVCCLLWTTHLKKKMEAVAKLINKSSKLPKERLCMQEVGLSDTKVTELLQHCVTFFDIFIDTEVLEAASASTVKSEEIWDNSNTQGPQPFAALAVSQTPAWYDLVMLHLQLANVLHMIAHFNLKGSKPLNNLFDSVAHPYFFQDITNRANLTWYRDDKRDSVRTEFLCRVITSSMEFIHQETAEGSNLSASQAVLWMSKCQNLASIWKINNDELRIHQVCQLYIMGFDRLAEEVVAAVNDTEKLASVLLPIAGRRMMSYISKTPDLLEQVSRMSPTLCKYLEGLNSHGVMVTNCSNDDTVELVQTVSRLLPESQPDYHISQLLLDATFMYQGKT